MQKEILSISIPPFPDFIEGNVRTFRRGEYHPNRQGLGYFDLIFVKKGRLFIAEGDNKYTVCENQMFILLPNQHHYSWQPFEEETTIYWIHFYTTAKWIQTDHVVKFNTVLPIPNVHYHQRSYTLHLNKFETLKEPQYIYNLIEKILRSTIEEYDNGIWHTEELFLRFLKIIENQSASKDRLTTIAENVKLYMEKNIKSSIDNQILSNHFHMHSNYISKATKTIFGKTALALLEELRIEKAKQHLLHTDNSVHSIATEVGYHSDIYFSNRFKSIVGVSPRNFRKRYRS